MAGQIARILVNFLEVAITSIVFHKGVYPSGAFERRRYMNLVVQKAKHPELENYIHSAVNGLFPFLEKGVVERVAVIFFDSDNSPLERYNFKFQVNQSGGPKVQESDLGFSLRSFLVKLSLSKALARVLPRGMMVCSLIVIFVKILRSYDPILPISILGRIPIVTTLVANDVWYQGSIWNNLFVVTNKDCRWEITAFFSPEAQISISNPVEHWIPTDTKQWHNIPLITPLKSMSSEPLSLQLYMEHPSLSEEKSDHI